MDQAYENITPRATALIAALHATVGNREAASEWLFELIAWLAFDAQRRTTFTAQAPQLLRPRSPAP